MAEAPENLSTFGVPDAERREGARSERVAGEQLRMVMSHTRAGTWLATAFAVLFAAYLHGATPQAWVLAWLAVKVLVSAVRIGVAQVHQRRLSPSSPSWRNGIDALLAADGLVWGVAGYWLGRQDVQVASLTAATLACVSCVGTFGLQISLRSTAAYVTPMIVPMSLGFMLRGDDLGTMAGPGLLLLLAVQLATARGAQRRLVAGIVLRLQAQRLAAEKDAAMREAQHLSAVKTQFLANVSHELRTPLHGILGIARLLHVDAAEPMARRRVEMIQSSGTHLLSLINDLLDVARLESGHLPLRPARFDLAGLVEGLADVYRVRAADKGLDFHLVIDVPRPTWVLGDAGRYRQVLHNLLSNALKFTQRGRIKMRLLRPDGGELLCVQVRDSGIGVDAAHHDAIFEPFRQIDGARSRSRQGTGLGLTLAREIARAMGGDIKVHSELGLGSTFEFTARLPAATLDDPVAAETAPGELFSLPGERAPLRLALVAEDDEVNALIVTAQLERLGVTVERVPDGRQAVGRALREVDRPDIVLMDCRMPVLDGLSATKEIRAQEATLGLSRIPIIALTATGGPSDREECDAAGMDALVTKPYTEEQLLQALRRFCDLVPRTAATSPSA